MKNIADYILVLGSTRDEHDRALETCLKRLSEKGLVLNSSKCSFLQTGLSFFGQIFSKKGTQPDPKRAEDLTNAIRGAGRKTKRRGQPIKKAPQIGGLDTQLSRSPWSPSSISREVLILPILNNSFYLFLQTEP